MLLSILISQGVLLTTISILGVVGNSMTVYVLVKVTDLHREGYQNIHQLRMSPSNGREKGYVGCNKQLRAPVKIITHYEWVMTPSPLDVLA